MDEKFWHKKWSDKQIGFHEGKPNELLVSHFNVLTLDVNSRVFVPLCGKTRDIDWLLTKGFRVVGVELSEQAIEQLFVELNIEPHIVQVGSMKHYSALNLDIFVGNFFDLTHQVLGHVDAVFDRAALVALPQDMRVEYTKHLRKITEQAPQLLITFSYDQSLMSGPPFSISTDEIAQHYAKYYHVQPLEDVTFEGGFKGNPDVSECIWFLSVFNDLK